MNWTIPKQRTFLSHTSLDKGCTGKVVLVNHSGLDGLVYGYDLLTRMPEEAGLVINGRPEIAPIGATCLHIWDALYCPADELDNADRILHYSTEPLPEGCELRRLGDTGHIVRPVLAEAALLAATDWLVIREVEKLLDIDHPLRQQREQWRQSLSKKMEDFA